MGPRFVRGALYVGAANWTTYVLNFVVGLAVAALLGPAAFGIYAFAVAINEFISIVNGFAIAPAMVQARHDGRTLAIRFHDDELPRRPVLGESFAHEPSRQRLQAARV